MKLKNKKKLWPNPRNPFRNTLIVTKIDQMCQAGSQYKEKP